VSYFFNEAASAEHLEYVAYYESCQVGLGARYLSAFDEAMDKVCQYPDRYRVDTPNGCSLMPVRFSGPTAWSHHRSACMKRAVQRLLLE